MWLNMERAGALHMAPSRNVSTVESKQAFSGIRLLENLENEEIKQVRFNQHADTYPVNW
jgi:hypothetical protein